MEKMIFTQQINAPKEKVWNILWEDASYRKWTAPFCEGSYAVNDNWKEGSKVLFLSPGGDGMVSKVAANRPCEFMSFIHLGEVKAGVEDTESEKVKQWAGAKENYTLTEVEGKTRLFGHINAVIEHDDAAVTEHALDACQRLMIQRRIKQMFRHISAERPANLHSPDVAARTAAAAKILDQCA